MLPYQEEELKKRGAKVVKSKISGFEKEPYYDVTSNSYSVKLTIYNTSFSPKVERKIVMGGADKPNYFNFYTVARNLLEIVRPNDICVKNHQTILDNNDIYIIVLKGKIVALGSITEEKFLRIGNSLSMCEILDFDSLLSYIDKIISDNQEKRINNCIDVLKSKVKESATDSKQLSEILDLIEKL